MTNGNTKIQQLRHRYIAMQMLANGLLALGCAIILGSLVHLIWPVTMLLAAVISFVIAFGAFTLIGRPWSISLDAICRTLNISYPQLEESSQLTLRPEGELNLLERLQLQKIETALTSIPAQPPVFTQRLKKVAWICGFALFIGVVLLMFGQRLQRGIASATQAGSVSSKSSSPPEKILPQIDGVSLTIAPPAYIGKSARTQDRFTIDAEEGATVTWKISTNVAVKKVSLIFNEGEKITLKSIRGTEWSISKVITKPGFYQVSIDGKLSDLYQVQVIKDAIPVIRVKTPKQYTHIDAGEAQRVNVNATITDDHGITNAQIFATVAKGSGESVKFKDTTFSFGTSFGSRSPKYDLQRSIDLPKLGMEPGDELYLYVQAQDTHQQKSRTDVLIVSIQDTAQLLSMDGLVAAANIKPEYFRSERQIILDTEKLLKEKDTISATAFKNRANELGTDQKLLRLRYGKFLGEEDESGHETEGIEEIGKAENFGNAKMVMDAFTDKHDNAEDATFLEPSVKAQLKATLNEMWKAELRLRLYKPQEALPFEYKALRLLKDLQQKSRSYVAKTNYNPPPIKPEKRLTGELDKIGNPTSQQDVKPAADRYAALTKATVVLQRARYASLSAADKKILQQAAPQLAAQASARPGMYLKALSALRRIISENGIPAPADWTAVEQAIQRTLPQNKTMPTAGSTTADMGLAQRYYQNLNR